MMTIAAMEFLAHHLMVVDCGCICEGCLDNNNLHLHREIEQLKRQLLEKDCHIVKMETNVLEGTPSSTGASPQRKYATAAESALEDEVALWQEKHHRLLDSHKRLQKVNQGLEDKLLKIVDKFETEKSALVREVTSLSSRLLSVEAALQSLRSENEQLRNDCSIAVQLLHCKPSNFLASKYSSLPNEFQEKVRQHFQLNRSTRSSAEPESSVARVIRVPIPTFPPTAMVYSVGASGGAISDESEATSSAAGDSNDQQPDYISAAIMAKILEEREQERQSMGRRVDKASQTGHHSKSATLPMCSTSNSNSGTNHSSSSDTSSVSSRSSWLQLHSSTSTPRQHSTETII